VGPYVMPKIGTWDAAVDATLRTTAVALPLALLALTLLSVACQVDEDLSLVADGDRT